MALFDVRPWRSATKRFWKTTDPRNKRRRQRPERPARFDALEERLVVGTMLVEIETILDCVLGDELSGKPLPELFQVAPSDAQTSRLVMIAAGPVPESDPWAPAIPQGEQSGGSLGSPEQTAGTWPEAFGSIQDVAAEPVELAVTSVDASSLGEPGSRLAPAVPKDGTTDADSVRVPSETYVAAPQDGPELPAIRSSNQEVSAEGTVRDLPTGPTGSGALAVSPTIDQPASVSTNTTGAATAAQPASALQVVAHRFGSPSRPQVFIQGSINSNDPIGRESRIELFSEPLGTLSPGGNTATLLGSKRVTKRSTAPVTFRSVIDANLAPGQSITVRVSDPLSNTLRFTASTVVVETDDLDSDGIPRGIESLGPNAGDGNHDGIPDYAQPQVASFPAFTGSGFVTLASPAFLLKDVRVSGSPLHPPRRVSFPHGLLGFEVDGVSPGGVVVLQMTLPADARPAAYYKADPSTGEMTRFDFDGATGAEITGNLVTLHLQDGGRGDADGQANGVIVDPGGPGEGGGGGNSPPTAVLTGSNGPVNEGDNLTFEGTGSSDPDGDPLTYTWDFGDGVTATAPALTHAYGDNGIYTVTLTVDDGMGGSDTATRTVTVNNVAPSMVPDFTSDYYCEGGGAAPASNGLTCGWATTSVFDLAIHDPGFRDSFVLVVQWGDGTTDEIGIDQGTTDVNVEHAFQDDNPSATPDDFMSLSICLTDDDGASSCENDTVHVFNVAPHISGLSATVTDEGQSTTLTGSVDDPGLGDTFIMSVNWGDGQSDEFTPSRGSFSYGHEYVDDNPSGTPSDHYTITAGVADDDTGTSPSATTTVTVNNVPPRIDSLSATPIDENASTTLSGILFDPGSLDTFTLVVNWGDGHSETHTPSSGGFSYTHQYLDDNPSGTPSDTYTITVTVTDDDTGSTTASTQVAVNNVAPTLSNLSAVPIDENESTTLTGSFSDPGTLDTFTLVVNWGDGQSSTFTPSPGSFSYTHRYLDDDPSGTASDNYTITVTVTDDDTGTASATTSVSVSNVPAALGEVWIDPETVYTGDSVSVHGVIDDPGTLDTFTVSIDWGDATSSGMTYPAGSTTFNVGRAYSFAGAYTVRITLADDDSGSASTTVFITVNDPPIDPPCQAWPADDSYQGNEDDGITAGPQGDSDGVLANDGNCLLRATLVSGPSHGTLQFHGDDGSFEYQPDANFNGQDQFVYEVECLSSFCNWPPPPDDDNQATVWITVDPVNDAPVLDPIGDKSVDAEKPLAFTATASDVDGPSQHLSFSLDPASLARGMTIDPDTGTFGWVPALEQALATYQVTVTVTDDGTPSLSDSKMFLVAVTGVAVLVENDLFTVGYDKSLVVPDHPGAVSFRFAHLVFDTSDPRSSKDAFEAALVDSHGLPVVGTVVGGRDAFFNITEGEEPALGRGAVYDPTLGKVTVDISHLAPGTALTLLTRLVNNDDDTTTRVNILKDVTLVQPSLVQHPSTVSPALGHALPEEIDFGRLSDVTESAGVTYHRTTFDEHGELFTVSLDLRNAGTYPIRSPLLIGIRNISEPGIEAVAPDGVTPDGMPYYDVSRLAFSKTDKLFQPGELVRGIYLTMLNVARVQFDYDLVVLGHLNEAPAFVSEPRREAVAGRAYAYTAIAQDPEADALTYSVVSGPEGMSVASGTGIVSWNPTAMDTGTHEVAVGVQDPFGGKSEQRFAVKVVDAPPNRPPIFTSDPEVDALVSAPYAYQATALDADDDALTFSVLQGPSGLTINASTGKVSWTPTADSVGPQWVELAVADGHGGSAKQHYVVLVRPPATPANHDPIIVSQPETQLANGVVTDPDGILTVPGPLGASVPVTFSWLDLHCSNGGWCDPHQVEFGLYKVDDAEGAVGDLKAKSTGYLEAALADQNRQVVFAYGQGTTGDHSTVLLEPGQGYAFYLVVGGTAQDFLDGPTVVGPFGFFSLPSLYGNADPLLADLASDPGATELTWSVSPPILQGAHVSFALDRSMLSGWRQVYQYAARAVDPDDDTVHWGLTAGPRGAIIDQDSGLLTWLTEPGDQTFSVRAADGYGGSDTQTFVVHVANVNPAEIAGNKFDGTVDACLPPEPPPSAEPGPLTLHKLASQIQSPIGIDYYDPADSLLVTVNYSSGGAPYNLELVDRNGDRSQFSTVSGLTDELKIATTPFQYCPGIPSQFPVGDAFFGNGVDGQIARLTDNGATLVDPWVDLPGEDNGLLRGFLYIDRTGVYGGDLIVGTTNGEVWRINAQGTPTEIADVDTHLEGGITVPNDARYGPLAGKIIAGAEQQGFLYAFNPFAEEGEPLYRTYDVGVNIEDIDLVPTRGHFYGIDFNAEGQNGQGGGAVLAADADALQWMAGDILLVQEAVPTEPATEGCSPNCTYRHTSGMWHLYWDVKEQQLKADPISLTEDSIRPNHWEHVTFAPVGIEGMEQVSPRKGLEGWTIFIDRNGNGHLDPEETFAQTDSEGIYSIRGLAPGTYHVVEEQQPGWEQTGPSTKTYDVTLVAGQLVRHVDFENKPLPPAPNSAPEFTSDPSRSAGVGSLYRYNASVVDPDGDTVTFDLPVHPAGMTVEAATGIVVWVPDSNQRGPHDVLLRARDGRGGESLQSWVLSVGTNTPPQITSAPDLNAAEHFEWTYRVAAKDPDSDVVRFTISHGPQGMTIGTDNVVRWTPPSTGDYPIIVKATDVWGATDTQSFTLQVTVNAPPHFTSKPKQNTSVNQPYTYQAVAVDPNPGDSVTYALTQAPAGADISIDPATGLLEWSDASDLGTFTIAVTASDPWGNAATQSFELRVVDPAANHAPAIGAKLPRGRIRAGLTLLYQVPATDPDNDPLLFSLVSGPSGLTISDTGLVLWATSPTDASESAYHFTVRVEDELAAFDQKTYTIYVSDNTTNHLPVITTTPRLNTVADRLYTYDADATDADGDDLVWTLEEAPDGMMIDPASGLVGYEPRSSDIGKHKVVVGVSDGIGFLATQTFTLTVRGANRPPRIESHPGTLTVLNTPYSYQVTASDPDDDPLRFTLDAASLQRGMTVNATTGEITWTPADAGTFRITVTAWDIFDFGTAQVYDLHVLDPSNRPPEITSNGSLDAEVGQTYIYDVVATDPNGDPITYSVTVDPAPHNAVSIDPDTGHLEWLPDPSEVGALFDFAVTAMDPGGLFERESYTVKVRAPDRAPEITSDPVGLVYARQTYRYDVQATDPDGDLLTYSLDQASRDRGMKIDEFGRITWVTHSSDIGLYTVIVSVRGFRLGADQQYPLAVVRDTEAPAVRIVPSADPADAGSRVFIQVHATDNVGVVNRTLTLVSFTDLAGTVTPLDTPLVLDSHGVARITVDAPGTLRFAATAADAQGNVGTADDLDLVVQGVPDSGLTVTIFAPDSSQIVTEPVAVEGIVQAVDPEHPESLTWTLTATPLAAADGSSGKGYATVIASGGAANASGLLGTFDTTLVENGPYLIELKAQDETAGGAVTKAVSRVVNVEGKLKLGNFTISFKDLEIPFAGIPITISRTYDTLRADRQLDFGYGWKFDLGNPKLQVDMAGGGLSGFADYVPLREGSRVTVMLADGTTHGFTFQPQEHRDNSFGLPDGSYVPFFLPDEGQASYLGVKEVRLLKVGDEYFDIGTNLPYNPARVEFGGAYTLFTRDGLRVGIDAQDPTRSWISDRNGNTLYFTADSIEAIQGPANNFGVLLKGLDGYSGLPVYVAKDRSGNDFHFQRTTLGEPTGRRVQIERDYAGRVVGVIDPAHNRIRYNYDSSGDLVAVTDRTGNTTQLAYLASRPHYLDQITDALGRPAARVDYTAEGRVLRLIDAAGKTTEYQYNLGQRSQTVTDPAGGEMTVAADARGNVTRAVDASNQVTVYTYDDADRMLSKTAVIGQEDNETNGETDDLHQTFDYNAYGDLVSQTDARGYAEDRIFSQYGDMEGSFDAYGNGTANRYDNVGNLIATTDPLGNTTRFVYDESGNLVEIRDQDDNLLVHNEYDDFGELTSTTDAFGRTTNFHYDITGNTTESWTMESQASQPEVRLANRSVFDLSGHATGISLVVSVGSSERTVWTTSSTYDPVAQPTLTTDRSGIDTENVYDLRGEAIETRTESHDESGNTRWLVERTVYDEAGRAVVTTDSCLGTAASCTATRTFYDVAGRAIRTERLSGAVVDIQGTAPNQVSVLSSPGTIVSASATAYDGLGRVSVMTDPSGAETHYTYNRFGDHIESRTQSRDADGNLVWLVSRTVYDNHGRPVLQADLYVDGSSTPVLGTHTVYDQFGRVIRSERYSGVVITITGNQSTWSTQGTLLSSTHTAYNDRGQVAQTIAADGQRSDYEYDWLGRRTATIGQAVPAESVGITSLPGGTPVRLRTETDYDDHGRVSVERTNLRQTTDADGAPVVDRSQARETHFDYDPFGNLSRTTYADGSFVLMRYDDFGRQTAEMQQVSAGTNAEWSDAAQSFILHGSDPVVLIPTKRFEYDAQGRLTAVVLPQVMNPANGEPAAPRYEYAYDEHGNQTLIRDPLGRETRFTFDQLGRQLTRTLPDGLTEEDRYNSFWQHELHIDFEGRVTRFVYDNSVGAGGRLAEKRLFNTLADYTSNPDAPAQTVSYSYDALGRLHQVIDSHGTTTYSYDVEGRTTRIESPEGAINYEHDPATGRRTRTHTGTAADPITDTRYGYDEIGRLKTVAVYERDNQPVTPAETTTYRYDVLGNLDRVDLANGVVAKYLYDALHRLTSLIHYSPDSTPNDLSDNPKLTEFDYTVRADGKRTSETATNWQTGSARTSLTTWRYDDVGRLVDEILDSYDASLDYTDHYVYDLVGNRLEKRHDQGANSSIDETDTYSYDANDRLLAELNDLASGTNTTTTYCYGTVGGSAGCEGTGNGTGGLSAAATYRTGKTVRETIGSALVEATNYRYTLSGRLSQAVIEKYSAGSVTCRDTATFDYDSTGIRVSATLKVETGNPLVHQSETGTTFLNDPQNTTAYSQVLEETQKDLITNALTKTVVYLLGHDVLAQTTFQPGGPALGTNAFFLYDGHGSTRVLSDGSAGVAVIGGVSQLYAYDGYGNAIGFDPGAAATSILYSGEQFETAVGQQYLRARYYDPADGHFNSLDPFFGQLSDPQSLHKYVYTHDDPVSATDPSGLSEWSLSGISARLGTFAGMVGQYLGPVMRGLRAAITFGGRIPLSRALFYSGTGLGLGWSWIHDTNPFISDDERADQLPVRAVIGNYNVIRFRTQKTADEVFDYLTGNAGGSALPGIERSGLAVGDGPINSTGQRLTFYFTSTLFALGQGRFQVEITKLDRQQRFMVATTLTDHPLAGWRWWRVREEGAGFIAVETGAVDHPQHVADYVKQFIGPTLAPGTDPILNPWEYMLLSITEWADGTDVDARRARGEWYGVGDERLKDFQRMVQP